MSKIFNANYSFFILLNLLFSNEFLAPSSSVVIIVFLCCAEVLLLSMEYEPCEY